MDLVIIVSQDHLMVKKIGLFILQHNAVVQAGLDKFVLNNLPEMLIQ